MFEDWMPLWNHPEDDNLTSAVIDLSKISNPVRMVVRRNRYWRKGNNKVPKYYFAFYRYCGKSGPQTPLSKDEAADFFQCAFEDFNDALDFICSLYGEEAYTREQVRIVMDGVCRDAQSGYYASDLLISDYLY